MWIKHKFASQITLIQPEEVKTGDADYSHVIPSRHRSEIF
jgi:hypothetical protein